MLLALGTAIFKPGLQGLIANQMPKEAESLGWGLFYQMVNIGGFVGPMIAGYLRVLDWTYVFLLCSFAISLNFIPLFFFKEPERTKEQLNASPAKLVRQAIAGLLEPRLFFFTAAFAGFWLMFYQLFDILPNFIDDWVDSRGPANFLKSFLVPIFGDGAVPTVHGGNLTQEWMLNFNGLTISLLAFAVGYATGRIRAMAAIIVGIGVAAAAIYGLGVSMMGWWTLLCIGFFSLGEMSASPTKMRFLARIAPPGKDGLYMGYANMTVGIGWSIGSVLAGHLYQETGDKVVLARRYMVEHLGQDPESIAALKKEFVLPWFEKLGQTDAWGARELLWNTYNPSGMWLIFTLIGIGSLTALFFYDRLLSKADKDPEHSFNTRGHRWVRGLLFPIIALCGLALYRDPTDAAVIILSMMFVGLLIASYMPKTFHRDDF